MVAQLQDRPPYIVFELRPVEDREQSTAAGAVVYRDEEFVIITPMGSKDRVERNAKDWFEQQEFQAQQGRLPRQWLEEYKAIYKAWKEGLEPPVVGIALRNWVGVSPAQLRGLQELGLRSVEDLAKANEETIARMGMGGRALHQKAVDFLLAAEKPGKLSEEMAKVRAENQVLKESNAVLEKQQAMLMSRLEVLEAAATKSSK